MGQSLRSTGWWLKPCWTCCADAAIMNIVESISEASSAQSSQDIEVQTMEI